MNPRDLALGVAVNAALFCGGWWVGVVLHRRRCEETHIRLYRRLLVAEANQDHAICKVTEQTMANYIAHQEHELDTLRAGAALVDEAERVTVEGS